MRKKDTYIDGLDYIGIGPRHGIENVYKYRPEYLRRYADDEYFDWVDASEFQLVNSEHIL
jgi:hypothetical protein